jgi:hypothetical protein
MPVPQDEQDISRSNDEENGVLAPWRCVGSSQPSLGSLGVASAAGATAAASSSVFIFGGIVDGEHGVVDGLVKQIRGRQFGIINRSSESAKPIFVRNKEVDDDLR